MFKNFPSPRISAIGLAGAVAVASLTVALGFQAFATATTNTALVSKLPESTTSETTVPSDVAPLIAVPTAVSVAEPSVQRPTVTSVAEERKLLNFALNTTTIAGHELQPAEEKLQVHRYRCLDGDCSRVLVAMTEGKTTKFVLAEQVTSGHYSAIDAKVVDLESGEQLFPHIVWDANCNEFAGKVQVDSDPDLLEAFTVKGDRIEKVSVSGLQISDECGA